MKSNIFYKVEKENKVVGYLLGTMHTYLSPQDYQNRRNWLKPYVQECNMFIFEADVKIPFTSLAFGLERALYELLEKKESKEIDYLETVEFQRAMLGRRFWLGSTIVYSPLNSYRLLQAMPRVVSFINKIILIFAWFYNVAYNICTAQKHSAAVFSYQKIQQEAAIKLFNEYQKEEIDELSADDAQFVCIEERHVDWKKFFENKKLEEPFFIAVGASHFPGDNGLLSMLQGFGYTCKPLFLNPELQKVVEE